jgi:uncharacterized protein
MTTIIGNINLGDKLTLLPHRLLHLEKNKIAIIGENSNGWCIADTNDYLYIKELFQNKEIIFTENFDEEKIKTFKLLWNSNLLEKNGVSLSKLVQSFSPVLLVLKLTGNCNFNCTYCYDYNESRRDKIIPITKVKNTISSLLAKNKKINLVFHGGEPLLQFSLLKEIVEFAITESKNSNQVSFFIQTNGALLTKEIMDFLEKHEFSIGFSLDGMTEETNIHRPVKYGSSCLEVFKRNTKKYGETLKKRSGVICVVSKTNLREIPAFILWLQELGVKGVVLSVMSPSGKADKIRQDCISPDELLELYNKLIAMIKSKRIHGIAIENIHKFVDSLINLRSSDVCYSNPCGAGDNFLVIDTEGNYRACDCTYHDFLLLDNDNLDSALGARPKALNRIEYMKNNLCRDCAIFGLCGGGCISEALASNGPERTIPKISCTLKKFFYKLLLKEYALDETKSLFNYYKRRNQTPKMI